MEAHTRLLYYEDACLREFAARVVALDGLAVALDRTAFYPGGGGQPHDTGSLSADGWTGAVRKVRREGDTVWHELEDAPPRDLLRSDIVGRLDWKRRYALMRTHTALHVLCGVVWRDYGASVTGGNMEPLKGRMDFEFETMRQELVHEIERRINDEVAQARRVCARILPRDQAFAIPDLIRTKVNLLPVGISEVRVVEIDGLDLQADGGTHVGDTSEVGPLRITGYKSKGRINKRIELALEA
jgi:misacylated tRNA(Ala) deacylase